MRYLLCVLLIAVVALSAPTAWGQSPTSDKPPTGPGPEIRGPGSLTLDHPLPAKPATATAGPGVDSTLMTEDFEGAFPSAGWTASDSDGLSNGEYYWDDDDYMSHLGGWSAWCANGGLNGLDPQYSNYPDNATSWMIYGPFDLSSATDAALSFYYWNISEVGYDKFWWAASTDGSNFYGYNVSGDSAGWQYVNFDLGSYVGDSSVWIGFYFASDTSNTYKGAFVDDVTLSATEGTVYDEKSYLPVAFAKLPFGFTFKPNPDGYYFENYGNDSHYWQDDLGVADLINMFGASQVCYSGTTPADCVLTSAAESWRQDWLSSGDGGHCEGMAVTSLRFYKGGQTFYTGDTTPSDFQPGAAHTYDLSLGTAAVQNYIMYYFALQGVPEVYNAMNSIRTTKSPNQILDLLRQELDKGAPDPYTLAFWHLTQGWGHAIVPYAITDKGGGVYWVYVYDNNYPNNQTLHFVFTTNNNTWSYSAPNYSTNGYNGSQNLTINHISVRKQEPFSTPWKKSATEIQFFLTRGGDLLITNAHGQRVGYDPATGQEVNEIPGARIVYLPGGARRMILLPVEQAGPMTHVTAIGRGLAGAVSTNLAIVGPGYVAGFEDIRLQPDQQLGMSVSPDGKQLIFEDGQAAPAPRTFLSPDEIEP